MRSTILCAVSIVLAASAVSTTRAEDIPTGTIVAYAGSTAPAHWLLCNGDVVPAQYKKLIAILVPGPTPAPGTVHVPDLRGQFLRGLDTLGSIDKQGGRTLLSAEGDSVGPHRHNYQMAVHAGGGKSGAGSPDVFADRTGTQTDENGSPGETRPVNVAVNFIIKAD